MIEFKSESLSKQIDKQIILCERRALAAAAPKMMPCAEVKTAEPRPSCRLDSNEIRLISKRDLEDGAAGLGLDPLARN